MQIIGKNLTLGDFREYVKTYDFGSIKPSSLVIHHTWSPTKSQWKGERSIAGLKSYYEGLKWNAGPHLFIAEDGIWLFTPMKEVGVHAGEGNSTYSMGRLKSYSIGIEVVGDYDVERWTGETLKNALGVIKTLMDHLKIQTETVYFHRDFSKKSCPGHAITKEWLFAELAKMTPEGRQATPQVEVSSWAKEAWDWQHNLGLDQTVLPHQKVEAEWIFAILKKYHDLNIKK